ncbi:peptide-methionine (S)-S-oxide reductase MsrA [Aquimarina muelleri]|uniref:Peptide methionine sulfoxide reductase MsrA n=1 Tax=Aquimarina muelleri TaxID=279356 RepID=A0A918N0Q7_9FLAO|nr:peptide-methionine (S)-S-oxide reductase MsrA [Aquimarina muelleri]MCX2762088.1 peptide-methionine (S)-S-oxide reductase MsrA [Aquimarina muelleri]GGX04367.1 peptide methionine sulfoxide reductase MsrA [Aquimarina muelleri]
MTENKFEVAVLAGGCFWCTEAIFQRLEGVDEVISGYTGGTMKNPSYNDIGTGQTGHAEVIKITYDPQSIGYKELLDIFFATHDPTSLNRQGDDQGTQYRSAIFYTNKEQKKIAEQVIDELTNKNIFEDVIVTEVTELDVFYNAENYHQDYYNQNSKQSYCEFVINPKLNKLSIIFEDKIKKENLK